MPRGKFEQLAAEFGGQQNGADLAFERDLGLAVFRGFDGDNCTSLTRIPVEQMVSIRSARPWSPAASAAATNPFIFCARQLLLAVAEQSALNFQEPRAAIRPATEVEEAVQRKEESVDRRRRVISFMQFVLPEADHLWCDRRAAQKGGKAQKRTAVLSIVAAARSSFSRAFK